jgi:hypothetical protein
MTKGMNWARVNSRALMWRKGVEDSKHQTSFASPLLSRPRVRRRARPSKSELRQQAARAFMTWRAKGG